MTERPSYPNGSEAPTVDYPLPPEPDAVVSVFPTCKHCQSHNLIREGWYRSKLLEEQGERRQIVRCADCNRFTYLAAGVTLARKPPNTDALRRQVDSRITLYEQTRGSSDIRPPCPRCSGSRVHRHGKTGNGKRCWECCDCKRSFLAEDVAGEFIDHRRTWLRPAEQARVEHSESVSPKDEAVFLFHVAKRSGNDFEAMRKTIGYTEGEKKCLEFLSAQGMLASGYEAMLKFRDDVLQKFNNLVDTELSVMAERLRDDSQPAMVGRDNPASVSNRAGEGAMSPSPVFSITQKDR
jgi:transposase-like protein